MILVGSIATAGPAAANNGCEDSPYFVMGKHVQNVQLRSDQRLVPQGNGTSRELSLMLSLNGQNLLVMQDDGNLVLYSGRVRSVLATARNGDWCRGLPGINRGISFERHKALWDTKTVRNPGAYAVMQADGNLVVRSARGRALWDSRTGGHPGSAHWRLTVTDDQDVRVTYEEKNRNGDLLYGVFWGRKGGRR